MVSRDATRLDNRSLDEISKAPQNLVRIKVLEYQSHLVGKYFKGLDNTLIVSRDCAPLGHELVAS